MMNTKTGKLVVFILAALALLAAPSPAAAATAWLDWLWPQLPQPQRAAVLFDDGHGAALFDYHAKVGTEVGGVLDVLRNTPGVEPVPTYGACFITSGGALAPAAWSRVTMVASRVETKSLNSAEP